MVTRKNGTTKTKAKPSIWRTLSSHLAAAIPVALDAPSTDEEFVLQAIAEGTQRYLRYNVPIYVWDYVRELRLLVVDPQQGVSFTENDLGFKSINGGSIARLMGVIAFLGSLKGRSGVFIFMDGHKYLSGIDENSIVLHRQLKILGDRFRRSGCVTDNDRTDDGHVRRLMFLGQDIQVHSDISRIIPTLKVPALSEREIRQEIQLQAAVFASRPDYEGYDIPSASDPIWTTLVRFAQGLTLKQIEQAVARSASDHGTLGQGTADYFYETKLQNLNEMGLTVQPQPKTPIGGLENLREWLEQRVTLFNDADPDDDPLRGVLFVGIPGCGKSLSAVTVGSMLKAPTILLQADKVFGSLVGESEKKMRKILDAIESVAPAVLWIDEIEKLFAVSEQDSVGSKIRGIFLTWMEQKSPHVVVVATANSLEALPPEMLRAGRFDAVFYVGLPTRTEREQIALIHLRSKGKAMDEGDRIALAAEIAALTEKYSGAEIKQVIINAELRCRIEGNKGTVTLDALKEEMAKMIPLALQEPERIEYMANHASRFIPASKPETQVESGSRGAPRRIRSID